MARAARDAGFDVHVATRVVDGGEAIRSERFTLHPFMFARGSISPQAILRAVIDLRSLYRRIAPSIVHNVAVQASILGSLAALGTKLKLVNALTGLGYLFTSSNKKAIALRSLAAMLLRLGCNRGQQIALVQNEDDRTALLSLGILPQRIVMIPGSGVDVERLRTQQEPYGPVTVGFVGRLLEDKGIHTLLAAHRQLRATGANIELLIAGTPDPSNPTSVSQQEASSWNDEAGITWVGYCDDMTTFWSRAHIAVLPSRREGLPKSLLEAAACQKPMISTDVPGCREIVRPNETGLLVSPDDPSALATAIATLADSHTLRARYGLAARKHVVENFSNEIIGGMITELYCNLLNRKAV